jgi:hypothetical protein
MVWNYFWEEWLPNSFMMILYEAKELFITSLTTPRHLEDTFMHQSWRSLARDNASRHAKAYKVDASNIPREWLPMYRGIPISIKVNLPTYQRTVDFDTSISTLSFNTCGVATS